ncbi:CsbD family protein [Flavisphingomonas formosensis]|uniref:CsbD family protein n=1 Tax=Flavisphingomonas formosensis TaxID=861534 RepID=UPI002FCCCD44
MLMAFGGLDVYHRRRRCGVRHRIANALLARRIDQFDPAPCRRPGHIVAARAKPIEASSGTRPLSRSFIWQFQRVRRGPRRQRRRPAMGEMMDKLKGHANEAVGKAKRAIGDAMDRPDIVAEGDAQEAKGDVQKAKGAVKGAINKV